jgi:hypothetical protein
VAGNFGILYLGSCLERLVTDRSLGLAEVIEALRAELTAAINAGAGEHLQFALDPVDLTLQTVVSKDGAGKIGWKVLEFGGSVERADTQLLKLRLTPVWKRRDGTLVRDFTISSTGVAGDSFGPSH